jgi:hypothetical protein
VPLNWKEIQSQSAQKPFVSFETSCELFCRRSSLRGILRCCSLCFISTQNSFKHLFHPQLFRVCLFKLISPWPNLISQNNKKANFKYQNAINWMKRNINFNSSSFSFYVVVVRCRFLRNLFVFWVFKHTRYDTTH